MGVLVRFVIVKHGVHIASQAGGSDTCDVTADDIVTTVSKMGRKVRPRV